MTRRRQLLLLTLAAFATWGLLVGVQLVRTGQSLQGVRAQLATLDESLVDRPVAQRSLALRELQRDADRAEQRAGSRLFAPLTVVPLLRDQVGAVRDSARVVTIVAHDVLPAAFDGVEGVNRALRVPGVTADPVRLRAAGRSWARAQAALAAARPPMARLERRTLLPPLDSARNDLTDRWQALSRSVGAAVSLTTAGPALLGERRPQTYFVALQNSAESRATGGIVSAYAIVRCDRGRLELLKVGVNDDLPPLDRPVLDLGSDFETRYGPSEAAQDWSSANTTPDFPTAGRLLAAMWNATSRPRVDGVLALDPLAMKALLTWTGPVPLSGGRTADAGTIVEGLLADIYRQFPDDRDTSDRTQVLREFMRSTFEAMSRRGGANGAGLLSAVRTASEGGHLLLYSRDRALQATLGVSPLGGALPTDRHHVLGVITQNLAGGKLDYYLRRSIRYEGRVEDDHVLRGSDLLEEHAYVTVTLTSTAPARGLPPYVTKRADLPDGTRAPAGQNRLWVSVYLGADAGADEALLDGRRIAMTSEREAGLRVLSTVLTLDPGQSRTLRLSVYQPLHRGEPLLYVQQPLVHPDSVWMRAAWTRTRYEPSLRPTPLP